MNKFGEYLDFNSEEIKVIEQIGEIEKTDTQSIRVILIEKDGKRFLSLQKWWRKTVDDDWMIGKGFHLSEVDTDKIKKYIEEAQGRFETV